MQIGTFTFQIAYNYRSYHGKHEASNNRASFGLLNGELPEVQSIWSHSSVLIDSKKNSDDYMSDLTTWSTSEELKPQIIRMDETNYLTSERPSKKFLIWDKYLWADLVFVSGAPPPSMATRKEISALSLPLPYWPPKYTRSLSLIYLE